MRVYTDGSASYLDGSAGYGVVYVVDSNHFYGEFNALSPRTTVQQAELMAVIHALSAEGLVEPIAIMSDSDYIVKTMNEYAREWLSRGLQQYGVTVFRNDTVIDLYRLLRQTVGSGALELTKSDDTEIANQDLWEQLWKLVSRFGNSVTFEKVIGHSDDVWNDLADHLAAQGRELSYERYGLVKAEARDRRIK